MIGFARVRLSQRAIPPRWAEAAHDAAPHTPSSVGGSSELLVIRPRLAQEVGNDGREWPLLAVDLRPSGRFRGCRPYLRPRFTKSSDEPGWLTHTCTTQWQSIARNLPPKTAAAFTFRHDGNVFSRPP